MSLLTEAARPWAPFGLGFIVGVGISLWALYDASWRMRHNAGPKWKYDTEYHRAWANLKRMNLRWSVILGGPFILGVAVWLVWFVLSLAAGVGGV
jgi:hypothetical protein